MSEQEINEAAVLLARAFSIVERCCPQGGDKLGGCVALAIGINAQRHGTDKVRSALRKLLENEDFWLVQKRLYSSVIVF